MLITLFFYTIPAVLTFIIAIVYTILGYKEDISEIGVMRIKTVLASTAMVIGAIIPIVNIIIVIVAAGVTYDEYKFEINDFLNRPAKFW